MKNTFLKTISALMLAVMFFGLNSCVEPTPQPEPDDPTTTAPLLEVKVKTADQTSAEIEINAKNIMEIAYVVSGEQSDMTMPAVLFATGTKVDPTETSVKLTDLDANKTYWVYFAAKVDASNFYEDILEVEVKTAGYSFDKMLTLMDTELMGYKIRITVPDEVKNEPEKYGIRYNFGSLLDVLLAKYEMGRLWSVSLMENGHGCMGWQETQVDTTVYINPWNENRLNPDGTTYIDPESGEPVMLHMPIAPNEPYIFTAGQYRYGHLDETGWGWSYGSEEKDWGYYVPLFDQAAWHAEYGQAPSKSNLVIDEAAGTIITGEEKYWADNSFGKNGTFQTLLFKTKEPELLETEFEVIVDNVSPIDAQVSFLTDENTYVYSYVICNDATYRSMVGDLLLGHEEWLQWLVCSFYGMNHLAFPTMAGNATVSARDFNGVALSEENLYHILVTVTGDEEGSKQKFIHETFETTAKVMGTPVIEVTPVEDNQNEYFAKFCVKAPNKDIVRAYYAADYKREFLLEVNAGELKYPDLCQNAFSEEDIQAINSDEGLIMQINSTDGQIMRLAVLGYNEEETANDLYSPEKSGKACPAVADCRTKLLDMVPKVNSPLFETLEGEWTATAKMHVREYDSNNNLQEYYSTFTTKIEILNTIETPALTQEVYDFYAGYGYSKEATDALYEDFKREAGLFNNYRLTYRNRLLCLGWFDYDGYYTPSRLSTMSPFDLFMHDTYSCIDNAQIFYDFGPKWYLEIDADGNVTVPFDQWQTPPMVNWQSSVFFLGAYNQETNHGYRSAVLSERPEAEGEVIMPAEFPVEVVSNDKIVIKPVMAPLYDEAGSELYAHYPNAIGGWGSADAQIIRPVVSEITLTRGWNGAKTKTSSARKTNDYVSIDLTGEDAAPVVVKSVTPIKNIEVPVFEQKPMYVLTQEMLDASIKSYIDQKYNKR